MQEPKTESNIQQSSQPVKMLQSFINTIIHTLLYHISS